MLSITPVNLHGLGYTPMSASMAPSDELPSNVPSPCTTNPNDPVCAEIHGTGEIDFDFSGWFKPLEDAFPWLTNDSSANVAAAAATGSATGGAGGAIGPGGTASNGPTPQPGFLNKYGGFLFIGLAILGAYWLHNKNAEVTHASV